MTVGDWISAGATIVQTTALLVGGACSPSWKKVGVAKVLANHAAVEAQESIFEEALVPLPDEAEEPLAYRLELQVYDRREPGGATQWSSQSIVPGALRPVTESRNPS